jgi:hypothetical protein
MKPFTSERIRAPAATREKRLTEQSSMANCPKTVLCNTISNTMDSAVASTAVYEKALVQRRSSLPATLENLSSTGVRLLAWLDTSTPDFEDADRLQRVIFGN